MNRQVCIALHDVAPATWPLCKRLLDILDEFQGIRVTLLVVPDFHGMGRIDRAQEVVRAVEYRLAMGDEVALHGYDHLDSAAPPRTLLDWFRRRVLTAGEGEFSALDFQAATEKIERGLQMMAGLRWPVSGFVPPAWLASEGARLAIARCGLNYTSTHKTLVQLPSCKTMWAPCITASPRSAWRRTASRMWLGISANLVQTAGVVRVGLHPADVRHADLMRSWKALLSRLLRDRDALTKSQALALASDS